MRQAGVFLLALLPLHAQSIGLEITVLRLVRGFDRTTTTIRIDYVSGSAERTVVDEKSGKVLQQRRLAGRPQGSKDEFWRAVAIIGNDPGLARLLADGAVTEGGFIVDGPAGGEANDRYIQIRLLSADRCTLLRVVIVDLSASRVASAKAWFD